MSLYLAKRFASVLLAVFVLLLKFVHSDVVAAAESDPVWTRDFAGIKTFTSSPTIGQDGTIYIGTYTYSTTQNALSAFSSDGTDKWDYPTSDSVSASAVGPDGAIYASAGTTLYALEPNGSARWTLTTPTGFLAPAIGKDGTLYVGALGDVFYAINGLDGSINWTSATVCGGSSPAIGADGTIYIYGCNKGLRALDPDGNEKWTIFVGAWESMTPTIDWDGTIYAGGWARLNAINPDGTEKWVFPLDGFAFGTAIGPDGTLYVSTTIHDGNLYAVNADGTQKWMFSPQKKPNSLSHPGIGADGTVYVGGWGDKFYAINPDGTEKWTFGTRTWESPAITTDGTLVAANDQALFAFNLTSGGLADSPWPMISHDPQHTGLQSNGVQIFHDGFDYPIGDRGYSSPFIYELPENISPESNDIYPSNPVANPYREGSAQGWYNANDVSNYSGIYGGINLCGLHPGEDWNLTGGDAGEAVYAAANGQVVSITPIKDDAIGNGYLVVLKHYSTVGDYVYSFYLHVTASDNVDGTIAPSVGDFTIGVGDWIWRGDVIARIGAVTKFPHHLHFEMRDWNVDINGETILWPNSNNGYYTGTGGLECAGMSEDQVRSAFIAMQTDGVIDPSDYIDKNRPLAVAKLFANDSEESLSIAFGDNLVVDATLDPGLLVGQEVDWWMFARTPVGSYTYDFDTGLWSSGRPVPSQGALVPQSYFFNVLDMSRLPRGNYTFTFGVDMTMDGKLSRTLSGDRLNVEIR